MSYGKSDRYPHPVPDISAIAQRDLSSISTDDQNRELTEFEARLHAWKDTLAEAGGGGAPAVSVEIPAFKGGWLMPCIESVLYQTSSCWSLSVRWDSGDQFARRLLEIVERLGHDRLRVYFGENRGIAYNRRFLTEHSSEEFILTLDDDDMLAPDAVEKLLAFARERPWAGIVRAKRQFIDETGNAAGEDTWFPFAPRRFERGMITDVFNHSQPALIRRSAYAKTTGWQGFPEFRSAGEDCDIFIKIEEVASIELLPDVLYFYRLSGQRTSLAITNDAAFEMWRRLADGAIERLGLPLRRVTDRPPFKYERIARAQPSRDMIDFVVCGPEGDGQARTVQSLKACNIDASAIHVELNAVDGAGARNQGFLKTKRPFVCFLAEGIEFAHPEALDVLLETLHERDADAVVPKIVSPNGSVEWAEPYFNERHQPVATGRGTDDRGKYDYVGDAKWLSITALLVRREVVLAVGGFDEGRGDGNAVAADFSLKALRRDFRVVYAGTATAVNHGTQAGGDDAAVCAWFDAKWNDRLRAS